MTKLRKNNIDSCFTFHKTNKHLLKLIFQGIIALVFCYFFLFNFVSSSFSQTSRTSYTLEFLSSDYQKVKKNYQKTFKDSIQRLNYLQEFQNTAVKKGYLLASMDSMYISGKAVKATFYLGPAFKEMQIDVDDADRIFLKNEFAIREKMIANTSFNPSEIASLLKGIQQNMENHGYPFGSVALHLKDFDSLVPRAQLQVKKGKYVRWTKIHVKGDEVISSKLISSYIRIKVGDEYSQQALSEVGMRLKQIPFIEELSPSSVLFTPEGAELFLYLKSKPISSVNGVVGLQQNPLSATLMLTGDLKLKLVNVIKKAESFDLNWRSLQAQTQSLQANLAVPNLLQTPFGVLGSFSLYKKDSSFLELKSMVGFQYGLGNGGFIKAFYKNENSNLFSGAKALALNNNMSSVSTNFYGLSLSKVDMDYLPNPTRGIQYNLDASLGQRRSRQTDTSSQIASSTYKFELQIAYYFSFAKRQVVKLRNYTQVYIAPNYFTNEVYRFGGQSIQRGFNEEALLGTAVSSFSIEYRYQVDLNSYAFLFYDQSWYENRASTQFVTDRPLGFGAGFSFGTNLGIFSISYAMGKQFDNPILLRDGKIHFGYVSYF